MLQRHHKMAATLTCFKMGEEELEWFTIQTEVPGHEPRPMHGVS